MAKYISFIALFGAALSIFSKLDASTSLSIANIYVRYIHPSLLTSTFSEDTTTLVTGASDGIGAEIVYQLCVQTKTNLILIARTESKMSELRKKCPNQEKVAVVVGDVTKSEAILTKNIKKGLDILQMREVDIAIVNAGGGFNSIEEMFWTVEETPEKAYRDMLELNYLGSVKTVKAVLSTFSSTSLDKKVIVGISSVAAMLPTPNASQYAASKAAMNAFFNSLRAQYSNQLNVVTVSLGPVVTNRKKDTLGDMVSSEKDLGMPIEKAVNLILSGVSVNILSLFYDLWISPQPVLFYTYVGEFLPDVAKLVGKPKGSGCGGSVICEMMKKQKDLKQ